MSLENKKMENFLNDIYNETTRNDKVYRRNFNQIFHALDDEFKKQYIDKLLNTGGPNYSIAIQILADLPSEDLKIEYLDRLGYLSPDSWTKVIMSLTSDEKKLEYLSRFEFRVFSRAEIISSLQSDEKKLEFLNEGPSHEGPLDDDGDTHFSRAIVIKSLSSDELKLQNQHKAYKGSEVQAEIIASLSSDDKKIEYLKHLENEDKDSIYTNGALLIILSLSSDKLKEKYINEYKDDYRVAEIIASLSVDELKQKYLNQIQLNSMEKANIISTFTSDDVKKDFLDEMFSNEGYNDFAYSCYMKVIVSLSSDEDKINYIKKIVPGLHARHELAQIVASISDEKLRNELIDKLYGTIKIRDALSQIGGKGIPLVNEADAIEKNKIQIQEKPIYGDQ